MRGKLLLWVAAAAVAPLLFPGLGCACAHDSGFETDAPAKGGGGGGGGGCGCGHCPAPSNNPEGPKAPPIEKCCCVEAHQMRGVSPEGWAPIVVEAANVDVELPAEIAGERPLRAPLRIAPRDSPPPLFLLNCALLL
jgi:hypothetical protein